MTRSAIRFAGHLHRNQRRASDRAAGAETAIIFAADKVAKVRELRTRIAQSQPSGESSPADVEHKHEHYIAGLGMLEQLIRDHPLTRQLRFELEALQTLPPQQA